MPATDGKSLDDAAKWRFGHDVRDRAGGHCWSQSQLSEPSRHRR